MRVGIVGPPWSAAGGVAATQRLLACGLAARGHALVLASEGVDAALPAGFEAVLGQPSAAVMRERHGCEVVLHLRTQPGMALWRASEGLREDYLAARARASRLPWLRALRSGAERRLAVQERRWLGQAELLVAHAEPLAVRLREVLGAGGPALRVIPNGVDVGRFQPDAAARVALREAWGLRPGGRVALFMGHGWRRKGLDLAVRAFREAASADDLLVVAGPEAQAGLWLAWARARLGRRVRDAGRAGDAVALISAADALLHPTRYDPASNAVLEAMAMGLPAVTTRADGSHARVPPALVVADAEDVVGLAGALRRGWAMGEAERAALMASSRAWHAPRMLEAWEALLEERRHG